MRFPPFFLLLAAVFRTSVSVKSSRSDHSEPTNFATVRDTSEQAVLPRSVSRGVQLPSAVGLRDNYSGWYVARSNSFVASGNNVHSTTFQCSTAFDIKACNCQRLECSFLMGSQITINAYTCAWYTFFINCDFLQHVVSYLRCKH